MSLSEDFMDIEGINEKLVEKKKIKCISKLLNSMGKDIWAYDLPIIDIGTNVVTI